MAYCSNCGHEMSDDVTTCPNCGTVRMSSVTPAAGSPGLRRTEGYAVASLVLGIVGLVACPLVASVLALILGNQARDRMRKDPTLEGEGMARAGIILGWIGVGFAVLGLVFVILTFVVSAVPTINSA